MQARNERDDLRALGGDCAAHGSTGWVASTSRHDALRWTAASGTFSSITVDSLAVTAVSTSGRVRRFPVTAPQDVTIAAR